MKQTARIALCILALLIVSASASLAAMGALVPAYFYPSGKGLNYWNAMNTAAAKIPLIAILNPNSGPGTAQDPNYVSAVNNLRAAGGRVIGYVPTGYTANTLQSVEAAVDRYYSFYTVDGIFVDEMTNDDSTAHLSYYANLYNYIHTNHPGSVVFGNPGTNTLELYFTDNTADALLIFESKSSAYNGFVPSSWVRYYPATRFAEAVYGVSSPSTMNSDVNKAKSQDIGWVYITNDSLPNPYDTLPNYWTQEVTAIANAQ